MASYLAKSVRGAVEEIVVSRLDLDHYVIAVSITGSNWCLFACIELAPPKIQFWIIGLPLQCSLGEH